MPIVESFKQSYFEAILDIEKNSFCVGTSVLNAYKENEEISLGDAVVATRSALQAGSIEATGKTLVDSFSAIIAGTTKTESVLVVGTPTTKTGFEKSSAEMALVKMDPQHTELAVKGQDRLVNPGSNTSLVDYQILQGDSYRPLVELPRLSPMQSVNR